MKDKKPVKYDGHCQKYTETEAYEKIRQGEPYVIRMRVIEFIFKLKLLTGSKRKYRG